MDKSFFAMIFFFISSFLNFNNNIFLEDNIYREVSKNICNIGEYGFRVEYTTSNDILDEFEMYKPYLNKYSMDSNEDFLSVEWEGNSLFVAKENDFIRVQLNLISKEVINIKNLLIKKDATAPPFATVGKPASVLSNKLLITNMKFSIKPNKPPKIMPPMAS